MRIEGNVESVAVSAALSGLLTLSNARELFRAVSRHPEIPLHRIARDSPEGVIAQVERLIAPTHRRRLVQALLPRHMQMLAGAEFLLILIVVFLFYILLFKSEKDPISHARRQIERWFEESTGKRESRPDEDRRRE